MVDENTSLLSSGSSKDDNNGATRRRSKLGSFSRFGGEFIIRLFIKKISFSSPVMLPIVCTSAIFGLVDDARLLRA